MFAVAYLFDGRFFIQDFDFLLRHFFFVIFTIFIKNCKNKQQKKRSFSTLKYKKTLKKKCGERTTTTF